MARTSRNGAPAPTVESLDDLDLDDMMMGDDLFEDELMDLGPMAQINPDELPDDKKNDESKAEEPKEEEPKKSEESKNNNKADSPKAEAKTKGAKSQDSAASKSQNDKTKAESPTVEELPKRRKTKRKTKSPMLLDEEDDIEEEVSKKKRKVKTKNEKKKTTKSKQTEKQTEETQPQPKEPATKAKVTKPKTSMPPPLSRPPSGVQVAAAGQFGSRQKRGHFALPLARATSDKLKNKSKPTPRPLVAPPSSSVGTLPTQKAKGRQASAPVPAVSASTTTPAPAETPTAKPIVPVIPPQNTFCGLLPSNTLFYPFMPALPAEPSIKNRKMFPVVDRINSIFMSFINTSGNSSKPAMNGATPASETEPICRIMQETLKDVNASSSATLPGSVLEQQAAEKRTAVANAIGSLRKTVSQMEKSRLTGDLFSVCALLKRQHDFIKQNLSNMERWCKDNFSEADYTATYGIDPLTAARKKKDGVGKVQTLLGSIAAQSGNPLLKVKVKCSSFKEPKMVGPLYAMLPPSVMGTVIPPGVAPVPEQPKSGKISTKKRKLTPPHLAGVPMAGVAALPPPVVVAGPKVAQSYVQINPSKRRQLVSELVSQTARELETSYLQGAEERRQALERRQTELKKLVEDDDVMVIHTAAMWRWIDNSGYFADFTEDTVHEYLRVAWAPEIEQPSALFRNASHTAQLSDKATTKTNDRVPTPKGGATKSLFDRLQSLLVEESDDELDDEEEEEEEDDSLFHDELDQPHSELNSCVPSEHVNLEDLTLDERAFLHLRAVGLMENSSFAKLESSISKEADALRRRDSEKDGKNSHKGEDTINNSDDDDDGIEDLIHAMSVDLVKLNKINNSRAAFVESASISHLDKMKDVKRRKEGESSLILKCQQLLKKNAKENKTRNSKLKTSAKDEIDLPW